MNEPELALRPMYPPVHYIPFGSKIFTNEDDKPPGYSFSQVVGRYEVVVDVGGICGRIDGSGPWVLDHHFPGVGSFPSAACAVLAHSEALREYYGAGLTGVVTHQAPDFDALVSAWLARKVVNGEIHGDFPDNAAAWEKVGTHLGSAAGDPAGAAMLLAKYAACVDAARMSSIKCHRERALHSVFYAALYRRGGDAGADGLSGFFDAAWHVMTTEGRNPFLDPLFDRGGAYDLELQLLQTQQETYLRDLRRSRRSLVTLPVNRDFEGWYVAGVATRPLLDAEGSLHSDALPEQEAGLGGHRLVDAIFLRDPECILFKEWVRTDDEHSILGHGFDFTAIAYSNGRPRAFINNLDYFFALDPERSNGAHLYPLWARLQAGHALSLAGQLAELEPLNGASAATVRSGFEARAGGFPEAFADPWWDSPNSHCTMVATPNHGALMPSGSRADLSDDPVVGVAQACLEYGRFGQALIHEYSLENTQGEVLPVLKEDVASTHPTAPNDGRLRFVDIPLESGDIRPEEKPQLACMATRFLGEITLEPRYIAIGQGVIAWNRRGFALVHTGSPEQSSLFRESVALLACVTAKIQCMAARMADAAKAEATVGSNASLNQAKSLRHDLLNDLLKLKLSASRAGGEAIRGLLDATGFDTILQTLDALTEDLDSRIREKGTQQQNRRVDTLNMILTIGTAIGLWTSWNQMEELKALDFMKPESFLPYFSGVVVSVSFGVIFWRFSRKNQKS